MGSRYTNNNFNLVFILDDEACDHDDDITSEISFKESKNFFLLAAVFCSTYLICRCYTYLVNEVYCKSLLSRQLPESAWKLTMGMGNGYGWQWSFPTLLNWLIMDKVFWLLVLSISILLSPCLDVLPSSKWNLLYLVSNYFFFNVYMCIKTKNNFPVLLSIHMTIQVTLKVVSLEMTDKVSIIFGSLAPEFYPHRVSTYWNYNYCK